MNFSYSQEQEGIRQRTREFVRAEVAPNAKERDETRQFDYQLYRRLGELGLIGLSLPEEYGGSGKDMLSYCLVLEEIAKVDMALSWIMLVSMASAHSVITQGTEEQKQLWMDEWIHGIIRGETTASTGITEPKAGSDASRIETTAVQTDNDTWLINGSKAFITGAGLENNVGVLAVCMTDPKIRRFDSILIPRNTPGFGIGDAYNKIGLNCSDTRPLEFDNCELPLYHRIGGAGGMKKTLEGLFVGRIILASTALGLAEECLTLASEFAKERNAFKRPIAEFQYIQGMLTEMALNVELGRSIRDKAVYLFENGKPFFKEASMAKWFICEKAKQAADYAVQIFGGRGYMSDCPVSRYYRDVRAATIAEGTTEVQRHVVAREMGLLGI